MIPIRSIARALNKVVVLVAGAAAMGCTGCSGEQSAGVTSAAPWSDVRRPEARFTLPIGAVDGRERCTAWHAGVSELDGRTGVNDFSVGIELVNLNDGKDPYPEAQYEAVKRILLDLRTRWEVPDERVVSHAAIARPVGRKSDPVGFDFEKLLKMVDP